jgi:L-amino acid N-acyltransferase YncA
LIGHEQRRTVDPSRPAPIPRQIATFRGSPTLPYSVVVSEPSESSLSIRQAVPDDAAGVVSVVATVVDERVHSAIDRAWTVERERSYLESLSPREVIHVAVNERSEIVGLQILDRWSSLESMAHVGQVGTFLLPAQRGQGVGHLLWTATASFARQAGYRKLLIQVRGTNARAQAFYRGLGFRECGRLERQVFIDGDEDDEILMELFV